MKRIFNYLNSLEGNATRADFSVAKECLCFLLKLSIVFGSIGGVLFIYIKNAL